MLFFLFFFSLCACWNWWMHVLNNLMFADRDWFLVRVSRRKSGRKFTTWQMEMVPKCVPCCLWCGDGWDSVFPSPFSSSTQRGLLFDFAPWRKIVCRLGFPFLKANWLRSWFCFWNKNSMSKNIHNMISMFILDISIFHWLVLGDSVTFSHQDDWKWH